MTRRELLDECERLALIARETNTAEDFNAWQSKEQELARLDDIR